jgi:hypothetical protein
MSEPSKTRTKPSQAAAHPSVAERAAAGRAARSQAAVTSHSGWMPAANRPDPVALLEEQDRSREPDLVPVRHGRMLASPFTFYRGAAKIMAADLEDNCAATRTCRTSASTLLRSVPSCSTSTTSTKPCPVPSSTTCCG